MDLELEIKSDNENKLLNRREIQMQVSYSGKTPTRIEIKEAACKKLNLSPDLTNVVNINQISGTQMSNILIYSHSSKEEAERHAKGKKKGGGAPKPAEKKAENKEKKEAVKKDEPKADKEEKDSTKK